MRKTGPGYSPESKNESASLVLDKDYTISQACKAVGAGDTALRRWVKQLESERGGATPKGKAITPEQRQIQGLEAKIKQIEWEKELLKKVTARVL